MALNRCGLTHCSLVPLYVWSSSGRRGTIKRYGIGADVLIMLGGLNEAVTGADATKAKSFTQKSKDAIDEVIAVCKDSGLSPNEELESRGAK